MTQIMSLPSRERGLKSTEDDIIKSNTKSLPSRERGLKSAQVYAVITLPRRSPRGSAD